jgi:hypothetical protein
LLDQVYPSADEAAIAGPRFANEHDVQANAHTMADQLPHFVPINGSTGGCEGDTLNAAALDALQDAAVDVGVQSEVVGVDKQMSVTGHGGRR